jgi:chromosome segregation ATPase
MRIGLLASVMVFSLVGLAAGDEPKRIDPIDLEFVEPDEDDDVQTGELPANPVLAEETNGESDERDRAREREQAEAERELEIEKLDTSIHYLQASLEGLRNDKLRGKKPGWEYEIAVRSLIEDTERHINRLQAERKRRLTERPANDPGQRIEHIRIAAKYLSAAGMHDLAHDLTEKAEAIEQEVSQAKERRAKRLEDFRRQFNTLRSQVEEHQREIKRIQDEMVELHSLMLEE